MKPQPEARLLTYKQSGRVLNCSERTVWSIVDSGRLPAVRIAPRIVRIDVDDLAAFIERSKTTAAAGVEGR